MGIRRALFSRGVWVSFPDETLDAHTALNLKRFGDLFSMACAWAQNVEEDSTNPLAGGSIENEKIVPHGGVPTR